MILVVNWIDFWTERGGITPSLVLSFPIVLGWNLIVFEGMLFFFKFKIEIILLMMMKFISSSERIFIIKVLRALIVDK